jgi:predicted DNA-binding protein
MGAENPRLNVVLSEDTFQTMEGLAKQEDKSMSAVAKELMVHAIEKHEDMLLAEMAMKREAKSKKTVREDEAWD